MINRTYEFQDNLEIVDAPLEFTTDMSPDSLIKSDPFDYFVINEGDYVIFRYQDILPDDPALADDEITNELLFQIDNTLESFEYNNEELTELPFLYRAICFCANVTPFKVVQGNVTGTKMDASTWDISMNVTLENDQQLIINEKFIASEMYTP